jgi:hypothetical protein
VRKEVFEDVSILSNLIEKNHQEFLTFRNQSLKFQSDMQKKSSVFEQRLARLEAA